MGRDAAVPDLAPQECVLDEHSEAIDKARAASSTEQAFGARLRRLGLHYYNTSPYSLAKLLGAPGDLADNLIDYVTAFSPSVVDINARFSFAKTISKLDEKDRLFLVVQQFADIDLHPDTISNASALVAASSRPGNESEDVEKVVSLMVSASSRNVSRYCLSQPRRYLTATGTRSGVGSLFSL